MESDVNTGTLTRQSGQNSQQVSHNAINRELLALLDRSEPSIINTIADTRPVNRNKVTQKQVSALNSQRKTLFVQSPGLPGGGSGLKTFQQLPRKSAHS